ncbi:hypothetical protein BJV82DRAFT_246085 [Fennellomyces sp. T-0311]|nr:hypothetical protein BJV82DRAFT_246085 [Fennellomyces sp. T-0311]
MGTRLQQSQPSYRWISSFAHGSKAYSTQAAESTSSIYRLSDDVLSYLLQSPVVDFGTLCALSQTSRRLRSVACHVLRYYRLPYIRLATVIDQEGRGKWTCVYEFNSLDETTLRVSFIPICHKGQRYRYDTSTEAPTLRYILATTSTADRLSPFVLRIRSTDEIATDQRIINNPNSRLNISQYGCSQKVVQAAHTAKLQTCTPPEWLLSYSVNTMHHLPLAHNTAHTDMHKSPIRYVIPVRLSGDISSLNQGFSSQSSATGCRRLIHCIFSFRWIRNGWFCNNPVIWS